LGIYCKPFAIPRVHYCQIDNIQPVRVWRVGPAILCTPVPRDGISLLFFLKQTTNRVNQKVCMVRGIFIATLFPVLANAASLEPATLQAWEQYIESTNSRMEQRLSPGKSFLWVDEAPERLARVRKGEVVISPVGPQNPRRVPSGLIHDWIGAVFIPNASLKDTLAVLSDYARYKEIFQPTVVHSKAIATSDAKDRFSLVLTNTSTLLKTTLDTDYESCYVRIDDRRGYTVSRTTRIQEIEEAGTPAERLMREGEGHGLIWGLFGITRYVERDGGVYVELEAIGLSRDIPPSFRWLIEPIVRRVSQASLSASLRQTEKAVRIHTELTSGATGSAGSMASTTSKAHSSH